VFAADDTVVAIATPPGRGGLGVVRISGRDALHVASGLIDCERPLTPRHATLTRLRAAARGEAAAVGDHVIAIFFPAPHSYTGQDVVELSAHGSPVVLEQIVRAAQARGARLARPGEFTLRAFVGGKIDLVQAEAVGDLIAAITPLQARLAFEQLDGSLTRRIATLHETLFDLIARLEASLDFPDEGYHFVGPGEVASGVTHLIGEIDRLIGEGRRGRTIREGATVVLAGRPNVGKSRLFNALLGHERAIVTDVPGTTRDMITERLDIEGVAVTLVDTAGFRDTDEAVEREGVLRGTRSREVADLTIVVIDASQPIGIDDRRLLDETATRPHVVAANKCDLPRHHDLDATGHELVSALTGDGLGLLRAAIARGLGALVPADTAAVSNLRHLSLLESAREQLEAVRVLVASEAPPEEFVLSHLQAVRGLFDEVVGHRTSDDVLERIFSTFCIGK
jgi:tRNA modification GTPase